jgi:hypothetical protein
MHLSPEEFVDVIDGTRSEASLPHLQSCSTCRDRIADLRATLTAAADASIAEPSPLFWDQFSQRVHDAVAMEPVRGGWRSWFGGLGMPLAAGAAVAALILAVSTARLIAPHPNLSPPQLAFVAAPPEPLEAGDPSFELMADLAGGMADWDAVEDVEFTARGTADHAVAHLSQGELRELQRLLQEELADKVS